LGPAIQQQAPAAPAVPNGGPLTYAGPAAGGPRRRHRGWVPVAVVLLGAGVAGLTVFGPTCFCRAREPANRAKCANSLREIALACIMYADQNGGQFPDNPGQLLLTEAITADVFICPSSSDERAAGPTTEAAAAELAAGRHLSYIYVGKGLTNRATDATVLLYEPGSNHARAGMNVCYADAHVQWYDAAAAARIVQELKAGHNPPRPETLR